VLLSDTMSKDIKNTWITQLTKSKENSKVFKESIMILFVAVLSNMLSNLKSVEWTAPSLLTTIRKRYTVMSTLDSNKSSTDFLGINLTLITLSSLSQNF